MSIEKNKMVALTYELSLEGTEGVYETASKENPLEFIFGAGLMIPKFEEAIAGLEAGAQFEVDIQAAEAYGEVNEEAIVSLPLSVFEVDGKVDEEMLKVGNTIPMMSSNGQRLNGIVLEVADEVKMDFNHPLAGEDLHFKGEVLSVRDASEEEINAALNPGHGCGSGSCGCGDGDHGHEEGGCGCGDGCSC